MQQQKDTLSEIVQYYINAILDNLPHLQDYSKTFLSILGRNHSLLTLCNITEMLETKLASPEEDKLHSLINVMVLLQITNIKFLDFLCELLLKTTYSIFDGKVVLEVAGLFVKK